VLNAYLSTMTRIIQQHQGTIDKYIGDAIMAFWNAPVDLNDHATRAVQTALDMQAALPQLNQEFAARGWPEVKIGVGVNTGRMSVGNMGSEFRMSYTVMGDAVNLGSRLEGITKQYGVGILATQPTVEADPLHAFMKIDDVRVKGKETPVAIYEPLGPKDGLPEARGRMRPNSRQPTRATRRRTGTPPNPPCVRSTPARRGRCMTSTSNASRISAKRRRPRTGTASSSTPPNSHYKTAMKLTVLGCSGGIGSGRHTTSLLVDDDVLIDAGSGITTLDFEQWLKIDHVFLTHAHLDHVLGLPLLLDSVGDLRANAGDGARAARGAGRAVRPSVQLAPVAGLSGNPEQRGAVAALCALGPGRGLTLNGAHLHPAAGQSRGARVRPASGHGAGSLVFSGDTTHSDAFVAALNAIPDLRHLIIETSFENALVEIAKASKHHWPDSLAAELQMLSVRPRCGSPT
jgi:hypothetical protein